MTVFSVSARSIPCAENEQELRFYLEEEDPMKAIVAQLGCLIKNVEYLKKEVREQDQKSRKNRHLGRLRFKRQKD
ncbi:Hypothetical predicted protein [Mytilus galloprovincialis]|nr:Hypothetical predicted protein [Mytilus galloprovincialis]